MSTYTYDNILIHAEQLSATEQLRLIKALLDSFNKQLASLESIEDTIPQIEEDLNLIEDAIAQTRQKFGSQKLHSITELECLGKETPLHDLMGYEGFAKDVWKGIDVEQYLNEERDSWNR